MDLNKSRTGKKPKHSPQQVIDLPYHSPEQLRLRFSHFATEDWALLFDSGKSEHQAAQFDMFLARPQATFTFSQGKTAITGFEDDTFDTPLLHEPFSDLRQFYKQGKQSSYDLPPELRHLPFHGGIAGYSSYDVGRYLEDITQRLPSDVSLPEMAFGLYEWVVISDHQQQKTYLLKLCHYCDDYWQDIVNEVEQLFSQTYPSAEQEFSLTTRFQSNVSAEDYATAFKQIHEYIHAGDCYQVNLAHRLSAHYSGNSWQAYLKLSEFNQAPFSAFMNLGQQQVLSLSPERFIQVSAKDDGKLHIVTQPIKGTRPRGKDAQEDLALSNELQSSEKDRAENLMIVDLLRNDIGRSAAIGSVEVSKLFELQSFPSVHHLVSTIEADLAVGKDVFDLLESCFPGGSITGAPKIRAMEIIEELESNRRSIYCGSFLYVDFRGEIDSSICIRTLLAEDGQLHTWGGGGLVADSQLDSEYQETYHKLSRIIPVLENSESS